MKYYDKIITINKREFMNRDFKEFDRTECKKILNSVIKNKHHSDKKKTMTFLEKLRKVEITEFEEVLSLAESYYYYIRQYFALSEEDKLIFVAAKIKEYRHHSKDLECCIQLFESDNVANVLKHTLSLEHFLLKDGVPVKIHKDVDLIFNYFKVTKNLNTPELRLLHRLMLENKEFYSLVVKEKTK